jgi:hypothetical protein
VKALITPKRVGPWLVTEQVTRASCWSAPLTDRGCRCRSVGGLCRRRRNANRKNHKA